MLRHRLETVLSALLIEGTGRLLLENGDRIVME